MTTDPTPVYAAPRDASSVACPNTRSRKRLHIAINVGVFPGYSREMYADAACDPGHMPLDMSLAGPAGQVPIHVRCRRPACAKRWPDV